MLRRPRADTAGTAGLSNVATVPLAGLVVVAALAAPQRRTAGLNSATSCPRPEEDKRGWPWLILEIADEASA